jgi:EamA domain-containing membrane protein RarD
MPVVIIAGIILVHLALIFYILFIINEHKQRKASTSVVALITLAVIFDISATSCMMIGTTKTYFTFHGSMGYAGLLMMIIDAVLIWKHKLQKGTELLFSKGLNLYSKLAFAWWMIAFITGVVVAINSR